MAHIAIHALLLLDGSGSMRAPESTGMPKHRAIARMVQRLITVLGEAHKVQRILRIIITIICYSGDWVDDVRLSAYDVKESEEFHRQHPYVDKDLDRWDPVIAHGGSTPIGRALAFARQMAEEWVKSAPNSVYHGAVICLLSDGMNIPETEPNGVEERNGIVDFNSAQEEQRKQGSERAELIWILTLGYYQYPEGQNREEDEGRKLLKALAFPEQLYFESAVAEEMVSFIVKAVVIAASRLSSSELPL